MSISTSFQVISAFWTNVRFHPRALDDFNPEALVKRIIACEMAVVQQYVYAVVAEEMVLIEVAHDEFEVLCGV
jgi:hypothetical protein